jgi:hypothetical protein
MSLFHLWVEATGSAGVFSWLSAHARDAGGLIRGAGIVPSVLAVLSVPPISTAAVGVARFVGREILSVAQAAWTGTKSLFGRCGTTGTRVVQTLRRTGPQVADVVRTVARRPMVRPVVQVLKATLGLVRPVSQGFVANRLLAALVPVLGLRAVIGCCSCPSLSTPTWLEMSGTGSPRRQPTPTPRAAMTPRAAKTPTALMTPREICSSVRSAAPSRCPARRRQVKVRRRTVSSGSRPEPFLGGVLNPSVVLSAISRRCFESQGGPFGHFSAVF